jgi:hypothetical protein
MFNYWTAFVKSAEEMNTASHHKHTRTLDSVGLEILESPIGFGQRIDGCMRPDGDLGRLRQQFATVLPGIAGN